MNKMNLQHSPLGKETNYKAEYDAGLLFPISRAEKRQEIARMLSGKITEASLIHADEMILDKHRKR